MTDTADTAQFSQETAIHLMMRHADLDGAIAEAMVEVREARARRKEFRKEIVDQHGINLAAFDKAMADAKVSGEEREVRDRHYRRLMHFIGKPVGTQGMFEFGEPSEADKAAVNVARLKEVDGDGYDAGLKGHSASLNTWSPGTEEFARWHTAWTRGQAEKVKAEIQPADPAPRRRGRPRKNPPAAAATAAQEPPIPFEPAPELPPAITNEEAYQLGLADGLDSVRGNAANFPPGNPSHSSYEFGYADGQKQSAGVTTH